VQETVQKTVRKTVPAQPAKHEFLSASDPRTLVLAACMMATFMAAVESTIVATAMPTIVADLGDFHLFSWVFAAYLLTQAVSIPIYGRLADLYGRKRMFYLGAGLFLMGSVLCGFAWGMLPLIGFRFLQGIGAGAVQPLAYVIVADIYTPAERARVQGLLSSMFGIAAVIGPTLGGLIVQHLSWSFIFWINVPIGAVAIAMLAIHFHEPARARPHQIDYIGAFLLMIGGGSLMTALVQIGKLGRGLLALLTALGLVALAALVVHESNAAEPVLPFRLWRNREVALCNFASLALGAIVISVGGFLPTYVQGVMGYSPSVAGIAFGATSIAWAFASFLAASIMIRTSFRASATIGGAAILAGNAILVAMTPSSGALWAATGAFVIGFGLGFCNTTYLVAVQAAATRSERGAVTSSNLFMRIVGQSVGAAIFGAVINIGIASYDPHLASLAERLMDPGIRGTFHGGDLAHLSATLGLALRNVYVIAALIGVAMLILGLRFPARPPTDDPA
jgi:EmrB/QacA subfamily drug resistance transporter